MGALLLSLLPLVPGIIEKLIGIFKPGEKTGPIKGELVMSLVVFVLQFLQQKGVIPKFTIDQTQIQHWSDTLVALLNAKGVLKGKDTDLSEVLKALSDGGAPATTPKTFMARIEVVG